MSIINIAIDGPAGAGKSTIAKAIAKSLGIVYLDTGAMYRAVALVASKNEIEYENVEALKEIVKSINIDIKYKNEEQIIFVDGEDVSADIRTPDISKGASIVAAIPDVRIKLVDLQRQIAAKESVVMDGRDIGTYVLPHADFKIFLTAAIEERAKRRYNELLDKPKDTEAKDFEEITFTDVLKDIEMRDEKDSKRAFAPLKKADDAVEIDTTGFTIHEVVDKVIKMAGSRI